MGLTTVKYEADNKKAKETVAEEHEIITTMIIPFSVRQLLKKKEHVDCQGAIRELFSYWRQRTMINVQARDVYEQYDILPLDDPHLSSYLEAIKSEPDEEHTELKQNFYEYCAQNQLVNTQLYESIYRAPSEPLYKCIHHPDLDNPWGLTPKILMRQLANVVESDGTSSDIESFGVNLSEQDIPQALERLWRMDPPTLSSNDRKTFKDVLDKQMFSLAADCKSFNKYGLSKLQLFERSTGDKIDALLKLMRVLITVSPWGFGEVSLTFSVKVNQQEDLLEKTTQIIYALSRAVGPIGTKERTHEREPAEYVLKSHDYHNEEHKPFQDLYQLYAKQNHISPVFFGEKGFTLWTMAHWFLALNNQKAVQLNGYEGKPIKRARKCFHLTSILPNKSWIQSRIEQASDDQYIEQMKNALVLIGQANRKKANLPMFRKEIAHYYETQTYLCRNGAVSLNSRQVDNENTWSIYSFQRTQLLFTLHIMNERNALRRALDEAHDMIWQLRDSGKDLIDDMEVDRISKLIEDLISLRLSFSTWSAGHEEHSDRLNALSETFELNQLRDEAENTVRELSTLVDRYMQRKELKVERTISRVALVLTPAAVLTGFMGMNNFDADKVFKEGKDLAGFEYFLSYFINS